MPAYTRFVPMIAALILASNSTAQQTPPAAPAPPAPPVTPAPASPVLPAPPAAPPAPAAERPSAAPNLPPEIAAGEDAFQDGDWQSAIDHYNEAIAKGPVSPFVHFHLGYALHMLKRYDEALKHHLLAIPIGQRPIRIDALYNCACAYALLNKPDQAMQYLTHAVDAGFKDLKQINADTDLDPLRNDPRFTALVGSIGKAPVLREQLDFLLGDWTATAPDGRTVEDISLSRPLRECEGIVSTATNAGGGAWTGLLSPNHTDRTWTWTSVDALGTSMTLQGAPLEPAGFRFVGRQSTVAGPGVHVRFTFTPATDGSVLESVEVSDDGAAWRTHHEQTLTRKPVPRAEPAATR